MAAIIPLGPQVKIGVRIGYAKAPEAKMVLMSLSPATITVTCAGASNSPAAVVLSASDSDTANSPAGYVGSLTLSGLSAFTNYNYSATNGTDTVTGSFYTLPGQNDDFCFYAVTCDAEAGVSDGNTDGEGIYKTIHDRITAGGLPCVGILHLDDHGYIAVRRFDDAAAVGLSASKPWELNTHYAYNAAWLNYYGLHASGTGDSGFGESTAYTTTANIDIGRSPHRVWCMRNLAVWPQWGDWEFKNDMGFDYPTTSPTSTANPFHKTYTAGVGNSDGGGYLSWQTFMAPLQPPLLNASNGNAWAFDLGCIRVISTDGVTNSNGAVTNYNADITSDDYAVTQIGSIFGSGQIADILAAVDPDMQFTIIGLANGVRYMNNYTYEWYAGTQHPIKNHCPAEFHALFTDAGSLADKPSTNNTQGITFTFNGDYHNGHIYHHQITDGDLPVDFYEVGLGTVTTSYNHDATSVTTAIGQSFKGSTIEYLDYECGPDFTHKAWGVKVSVYGSKAFKEIIITLFDSAGSVLWENKFLGQFGNAKYDSDMVVPKLQAG